MPKNVFQKYGTYTTFPFVITFIFILFVTLLLTGILLPVGMVLYEFGLLKSIFQTFGFAPDVNTNIGILTLPALLNIPITIIAGTAFFYCGIKLRQVLEKYMKFVVSLHN